MAQRRGKMGAPRGPRRSALGDALRDAKPMSREKIDAWRGSVKLNRPADVALADLEAVLARLG